MDFTISLSLAVLLAIPVGGCAASRTNSPSPTKVVSRTTAEPVVGLPSTSPRNANSNGHAGHDMSKMSGMKDSAPSSEPGDHAHPE